MHSKIIYKHALFFLLAILIITIPTFAQSQDYDNNWEAGFYVNGLDSPAYSIIDFSGNQVIGGYFKHAGALEANGIVGWDPVDESFFPLGTGVSGYVKDMVVFEGDLVVMGWFSEAGGCPVNNVARWDGTSWSAVGNGIPYVADGITVFNGDIYIGKYRWTGTEWENFAQADGAINDLCVWDGKLIFAGFFDEVRGVQVSSVCSWDGMTIAPLGQGFENGVIQLQSYAGHLIAGAPQELSNEVTYDFIQSWDGNTWTSLNFMIPENGGVAHLTMGEFEGNLLVSANVGYFFYSEELMRQHDGTQWTSLLEMLEPSSIRAFHAVGSDLYVGGSFSGTQTAVMANLLKFDGSTVHSLVQGGLGLTSGASSLCNYSGNLVVGGGFKFAGMVSSPAASAWTGSNWIDVSSLILGGGPYVHSSTSRFLNLVCEGEQLYANYSEQRGCLEYRDFCSWNSSLNQWEQLASGKTDLAMNDGVVYALGYGNESDFWFLAENQWTTMPGDFDSFVSCVYSWNEAIVVGGAFSHVDALEVNRVAMWDGEQYSSLGNGLPGQVYSFGIFNDQLVACYAFEGTYYSAIWDGFQWQNMAGEFEKVINCFQQFGDHLYAGGRFEEVDGNPAGRLAWWNGTSWIPYGKGVSDTIYDMDVYDGKLYLAGNFSQTGNLASRGLACLPEPLDSLTPVSQEIQLPSDLVFGPNSPNPFNPMTNFTFHLPRECHVQMDVYDVRGRFVSQVVRGNFPAGENSATWNGDNKSGSDAPSGIYFVRIVSDVGVQTRKIMLAR